MASVSQKGAAQHKACMVQRNLSSFGSTFHEADRARMCR